ncbi:DMT family transporter [Bacillus cereus group sp. BfR-BA-01383]|uniref:DMT family transporter n=1 Tax=Bacillus cereus group sp. BfR-BA-01383 TaxID=2920327 RepID=UPI001F59F6C0|nr:DMT family transporter [Bacillus cereus group sp. BfR-BA-01383]
MKGIVFAVFAGVFITLQGTFNAKLSSHIGIWSTSIITHLMGFLFATTVFLLKKEEKVTDLKGVKKVYLAAGAFGGLIICIMGAIKRLGPAYTVLISLITQLVVTLCIDTFGLFVMESIPLQINKLVGIGLLIVEEEFLKIYF